jgi:hypothetical protein
VIHLLIKLEDYLVGHSKLKFDAAYELLATTLQGLGCAAEFEIQRPEGINVWQGATPPK